SPLPGWISSSERPILKTSLPVPEKNRLQPTILQLFPRLLVSLLVVPIRLTAVLIPRRRRSSGRANHSSTCRPHCVRRLSPLHPKKKRRRKRKKPRPKPNWLSPRSSPPLRASPNRRRRRQFRQSL